MLKIYYTLIKLSFKWKKPPKLSKKNSKLIFPAFLKPPTVIFDGVL